MHRFLLINIWRDIQTCNLWIIKIKNKIKNSNKFFLCIGNIVDWIMWRKSKT